MKGDFSRWHHHRRDNFNGVLPQQGRVLLDADGTDQTRILNDWQDVAAADVIGAGVAAVPAELPDAFRITRARVLAGEVVVTVQPGRVWADGLLLHLPEIAPVDRVAKYLEPPIQQPAGTVASIAAGVRDAVVLEVWREALNGFQLPDLLIEPALGGPDTAERVHTASAFRLYRMGAEDTCASIPLDDDFSVRGKLKVTLQPSIAVGGDCPVVQGGGYTGFEHHLYRVEIADVAAGGPMFKWSRFNGGLVGRGVFDAAGLRVNITANLAAVNTCGLSQFYLEAEEFDAQRGHWVVTYGAPVTLNSSNQLVLPAGPGTFGTIPTSPNAVFFRLWDGIRDTAAFPIGPNPVELEDGIRLEFEAPAATNYVPRDYWTFAVRAGGIGNPQTLVNSQPPQGIRRHRVPLGIIAWNAASDVTAAAGGISDCRRPFQPLTRVSACCTYRVGDGLASEGDFKSVQAAINALPITGGEICVLPGVYREHVSILGAGNIHLHGCGPRSRIVAPTQPNEANPLPAIHVRDSHGIRIASLAVEAQPLGVGILLDNTGFDEAPLLPGGQIPKLREIGLADLRITAQARSAIEARDGRFIEIRHCDIRMIDTPGGWPGIFFLGDDGVIEDNQVRVRSRRQLDDGGTWPAPAGTALGGIQIGGTSDRVRIINNVIQGGIGNGITLGSVLVLDANNGDTGIRIGWVVNAGDLCNPCKPGSVFLPSDPAGDGTRTVSAGPLTEIRIERNRIFDMGLNGIGVVAFFDLRNARETITVQGLSILGNHIRGCLRREIEAIPAAMVERIGYGGIALADVEDLVVWDNVIENNGPRRLDPVCGIFVLLGDGIDISRNEILNNGARTAEPVDSARRGQRGGIIIRHATAPVLEPAASEDPAVPAQPSVQTGRPALRVHDNVVVTPMGRALSASALGPVSVVGNQFVTQAVAPFQTGALEAFLVATVYINNLGRNPELTSWKASYQAVRAGNVQPDTGYAFTSNTFSFASRRALAPAVRFFLGGQVLFATNQVTLDLSETGLAAAAASVTITSLDDVGFTANQCLAQLADGVLQVNAVLFGISLRANDNRWEEPVPNAAYSAMTLGSMNMTVHNIATHCLLAVGLKLLVSSPNLVLLGQSGDDPCAVPAGILAGFGTILGG